MHVLPGHEISFVGLGPAARPGACYLLGPGAIPLHDLGDVAERASVSPVRCGLLTQRRQQAALAELKHRRHEYVGVT